MKIITTYNIGDCIVFKKMMYNDRTPIERMGMISRIWVDKDCNILYEVGEGGRILDVLESDVIAKLVREDNFEA